MGNESFAIKRGAASGASVPAVAWKVTSEVVRVYIWLLQNSAYLLRLMQ